MDAMISMTGAAAIALLITMGMALIRLLAGPSLFDRVLAVNMFGTKTVLLIAVVGYVTDRPDFLDIALAYALINFIGTIAILRFFRYRSFADPAEREEELRHGMD